MTKHDLDNLWSLSVEELTQQRQLHKEWVSACDQILKLRKSVGDTIAKPKREQQVNHVAREVVSNTDQRQ